MLDYRLDDLGWVEFELLVQTLLKARFGMGIEAWGGRGDWGRDAYFEGELKYPANDQTSGPFLFQCKFVEGANAAGANADDIVLAAVRKECAEVKKRTKKWGALPKHFSLFTNAPTDPALRKEISDALKVVLPEAQFHTHDGKDICTWLASTPEVVRGFPQLLSLRDLQDLLRSAVTAETLVRSQSAISLAEAHARAFVPTKPYYAAREKLGKYHFVVLEGPPEMGKTTIGRIVALAQVCAGWEALECRQPREVLSTYVRDKKQVFVADDFFGRTEYDPTRVSEWQAELAHILPLLDSSHWLILTSRAHLLEMAKSNLDVAGQNNRFPKLGEVIVNANTLNDIERARILYRHAKAASLSTGGRLLVKTHAAAIVKNTSFTPERIRRLVAEVIPFVVADGRTDVGELLLEAMTNPTTQMRISFRKLPEPHRWLMHSLLEADMRTDEKFVESRYNALCPADGHRPFGTILNELNDSFIRRSPGVSWSSHQMIPASVDWVHPSCRDLAIEELAGNRRDREQFLKNCTGSGLLLATSVGGGAAGRRNLPLLPLDTDWGLFSARADELIEANFRTINALWKNCAALIETAKAVGELTAATERLIGLFRGRFLPMCFLIVSRDGGAYRHGGDFRAVCEVCRGVGIAPKIELDLAWTLSREQVAAWTADGAELWEDNEVPTHVYEFVDTVHQFMPAEYHRAVELGFVAELAAGLADRAAEECDAGYNFSRKGENELGEIVSAYQELSDTYDKLADLPGLSEDLFDRLSTASWEFRSTAESAAENLSQEPDAEYEGGASSDAGEMSIGDVFSDL